MRIEQTACTHHAAHLPKAGHRNDEAQNIRLHPRPDRRVEKAQKTPPAAVAVLLHGLRHDRAAPRPEGRRHGVRRIVVERRPRHQPRQRIGHREKEDSLRSVERLRNVRPHEFEPRLRRGTQVESGDELQHHFGRPLIALLERHELRNEFGHRAESRVELPATAADIAGIQTHGQPPARFGQRLEETAPDLAGFRIK